MAHRVASIAACTAPTKLAAWRPFQALLAKIDARWFQILFLASFLIVDATNQQRCHATVCVLHDLRPDDHATAPQRTRGVRNRGRSACVRVAIRALQTTQFDRRFVRRECNGAAYQLGAAKATI